MNVERLRTLGVTFARNRMVGLPAEDAGLLLYRDVEQLRAAAAANGVAWLKMQLAERVYAKAALAEWRRIHAAMSSQWGNA